MGSHINFTPKISKLDIHLGYVQVLFSSNFPIIMCSSFWMVVVPLACTEGGTIFSVQLILSCSEIFILGGTYFMRVQI